jgi:hypothetical protein
MRRDGVDEHYEGLMRAHWAKMEAGKAASRPDSKPKAGLDAVRLSDVKAEPVEWLWRDHLALGKIALLGGAPCLGKSLIAIDAIARVTTGSAWPDGTPCPRGSAIVLASEDGLADTIWPRLEAAGGDASRVQIVRDNRTAKGEIEQFNLSRHLGSWATSL